MILSRQDAACFCYLLFICRGCDESIFGSLLVLYEGENSSSTVILGRLFLMVVTTPALKVLRIIFTSAWNIATILLWLLGKSKSLFTWTRNQTVCWWPAHTGRHPIEKTKQKTSWACSAVATPNLTFLQHWLSDILQRSASSCLSMVAACHGMYVAKAEATLHRACAFTHIHTYAIKCMSFTPARVSGSERVCAWTTLWTARLNLNTVSFILLFW